MELAYSFTANKYFKPFVTGKFHIYRLGFLSTAENARFYELHSYGLDETFHRMKLDPFKDFKDSETEPGKVPPAIVMNNLRISDFKVLTC